MPKVSVIIPIYKSEKYLSGCLDAVIEQTYKDIEIICVNDGSPDSCPKILEEYAKKDKRITVIKQGNQGQSVARNTGLDHAKGDYLFFVDSDDRLHPKAIEILLNIAEKTNAPITVSNLFLKTSKKQKYNPLENTYSINYKTHTDVMKDMLAQRYLSSLVWNKLFRKDVLKDWRFIKGIKFEDWPLVTCVFSEVPFYVSVDVPLYFYNDTDESTVRSPFTVKKIQDYVTGIKFVYNYFQQPEKRKYWRLVQKTRIYQSIKMVLNKTYHTKVNKNEVIKEFFKNYDEVHSKKIILLRDFSPKSIWRLLKLQSYKRKKDR